MDKWELIEITLNQLIEQWGVNKEQFDIDVVDDTYSNGYTERSILWCPVDLNDASEDRSATDSIKIRKGIVITNRGNEFRCVIFKVDSVDLKGTKGVPAENSITAKKRLIPFRSLYRKFMKLRSEISTYKRNKANSSYMSNLCGMFPGTMDEHLIGGDDVEGDQ